MKDYFKLYANNYSNGLNIVNDLLFKSYKILIKYKKY